jgi:cyanophycinase-like exopeptidase
MFGGTLLTFPATHFLPGDRDPQGRMGRLLAFLANMAAGRPAVAGQPRGIAVANSTAVLVEPDGRARVVGRNSAYFVTSALDRPAITSRPLNWTASEVVKVDHGGRFNLITWSGGGRRYRITVANGRLIVEGNNDVY